MEMNNKDFVVFILSHGRPNKVITYKTIRDAGYIGPVYIVVDNEDTTIDEYKELYGDDMILIFNKRDYAERVDNGDNFNNYRSTTHVRNALFDEAKKLNYTYFLALDDDYQNFQVRFNSRFEFKTTKIVKNLNQYFDIVLNYYKSVKNVKSICLAQGGDYFGGPNGPFGKKLWMKRKAMNSWFCSTDRRFQFISRLNEDVNTYMTLGSRGQLFFTINNLDLTQTTTQANTGGMTEAYLEGGTYVKSFYTVMYGPSYCTVQMMGKRLHHLIRWKNAVPLLLEEKYKKTK